MRSIRREGGVQSVKRVLGLTLGLRRSDDWRWFLSVEDVMRAVDCMYRGFESMTEGL